MAQFNPSQILSQLPQRRRNTLVDYDPVSLPDISTPSDAVLLASMAGAVAKQAADAYVQSQQNEMDYSLKLAEVSSVNKNRQATYDLAERRQNFEENTAKNEETKDAIKNADWKSKGDLIATGFSDDANGEMLRRSYQTEYNNNQLSYDQHVAFETKYAGMKPQQIIQTEDGRKDLNKYMANRIFENDRLGVKRSPSFTSGLKEYVSNKDWYDFVSSGGIEDFASQAGLDIGITSAIKQLPREAGLDAISLIIKQQVKGVDQQEIRNLIGLASLYQTTIKNEKDILGDKSRDMTLDGIRKKNIADSQNRFNDIIVEVKNAITPAKPDSIEGVTNDALLKYMKDNKLTDKDAAMRGLFNFITPKGGFATEEDYLKALREYLK